MVSLGTIFLLFQVPPQLNARGKAIGEQKFHLETFKTDVTSKALPLAYSFSKPNTDTAESLPDSSKVCDYKDCMAGPSESSIRLSCFHTVHCCCYQISNNQCPICTEPVIAEMTKLSHSFNKLIRVYSSQQNPNLLHLQLQVPLRVQMTRKS